MNATYEPYQLEFLNPILTSRGAMSFKNGYILKLESEGYTGIGECSFIEGLSMDDLADYENKLQELCFELNHGIVPERAYFRACPSIWFGYECAMFDLHTQNKQVIFPSDFTDGKAGIPINGLIWMGEESFLIKQLEVKLANGFKCIKLKVGALDFDKECHILKSIRKKYSGNEIELRLDANGAFSKKDVREKLQALKPFTIHSIEQPIQPNQPELMAKLCAENIIPIALDEELIGVYEFAEKEELLKSILPRYIILKPSLIGGLESTEEWIQIAKKYSIQWWATSALESNIGLSYIAQWVFRKKTTLPQGLGTGGLYKTNFPSNLRIEKGVLFYK